MMQYHYSWRARNDICATCTVQRNRSEEFWKNENGEMERTFVSHAIQTCADVEAVRRRHFPTQSRLEPYDRATTNASLVLPFASKYLHPLSHRKGEEVFPLSHVSHLLHSRFSVLTCTLCPYIPCRTATRADQACTHPIPPRLIIVYFHLYPHH